MIIPTNLKEYNVAAILLLLLLAAGVSSSLPNAHAQKLYNKVWTAWGESEKKLAISGG